MPTRPIKHKPIRAGGIRSVRQQADLDRGSSAARGYGPAWRKLRLAILRERPLCEAPGCNHGATDVDHRIARERGGTDDPSNLVALCHACHSRKTVRVDGGFGRARQQGE